MNGFEELGRRTVPHGSGGKRKVQGFSDLSLATIRSSGGWRGGTEVPWTKVEIMAREAGARGEMKEAQIWMGSHSVP